MKPSFPNLKQINLKQLNLKPYLPRNPVLRDFVVCFMIWLALEIVCSAIASMIKVSFVEIQPQQLLMLSVLFGIGGACLMATSTQLILARTVAGIPPSRRRIMRLLSLALSWLGLIGIAFPVLTLSFQIALWMMLPFRA